MITWIVGSVFILLILVVLWRLQRAVETSLSHEIQVEGDGADYPPLSIIKPVYGMDRHTMENFCSWAEQDYPAPLQLVFSFQANDDPALPLAESVTGPHEYQVIVNPVDEGYSGKMSNLLNGLHVTSHDFLVFSDSDIRVHPKFAVNLLLCTAREPT